MSQIRTKGLIIFATCLGKIQASIYVIYNLHYYNNKFNLKRENSKLKKLN